MCAVGIVVNKNKSVSCSCETNSLIRKTDSYTSKYAGPSLISSFMRMSMGGMEVIIGVCL